MDGLTTVNIELTSRCNKNCWMCGRRKQEKEYPELCNWGDMPFKMVEKIESQIYESIVVQFHWDGEPTLYPELGKALSLFEGHIRQFDTNGKLLVEKADEIIDNLEILTLSVIQDDPEAEEQYEILRRFLSIKKEKKPRMVYRCLGNVETAPYKDLPGIVATRILHDPMGSFNYKKKVTIPEIGICLEILNRLAIDRFGNVSPCVRFDPYKRNILGNISVSSLSEIWYGCDRECLKKLHINGNRNNIDFCSNCDYWGVANG